MKPSTTSFRAFAFAAGLGLIGMLGFYRPTGAQQPQKLSAPFANSVEQRMDMIGQLKVIQELLREQNELLRSGKIKVVVELPPK